MYQFLKSLKAGTEDETLGRHILREWSGTFCAGRDAPVVLDIGAGHGSDLLAVRESNPGAVLHAVESFPNSVARLQQAGVNVHDIDIERAPLPLADASADLVICNQVFEHLKEIFWLASEIERVLKPDGAAIIGVPNLGSLHNRVALTFGMQPPCIHVVGPHVRAFTVRGMRSFFEISGTLRVEKVAGGNFYPFPKGMARLLCRLMPGLAVSSFYFVRRTGSDRRFLDFFDDPIGRQMVDTPFYRGPE